MKKYFSSQTPTEIDTKSDESPNVKAHETNDFEQIFITNAGIVLVYPFLAHYFQTLGLLTPLKKFKSDQEAHRAVHLLQYLATGQTESPEYLMAFNKLLCGLPFEFVIESEIVLTEEEIQLSNALLEAVIQQWTILKNTSVDGLRGSFLIRKGKLTPKKKDWVLNVEQKTYDLLLNQLPWGISMIRLPWMKNILYVEWR